MNGNPSGERGGLNNEEWEQFCADVMASAAYYRDVSDEELVDDGSLSDQVVAAIAENRSRDDSGFFPSTADTEAHLDKALNTYHDLVGLGLVTYFTPDDGGPVYDPHDPSHAGVRLAFFADLPEVVLVLRGPDVYAALNKVIVDRREQNRPRCHWAVNDSCSSYEWLYNLEQSRGQFLVLFSVCGPCLEWVRANHGNQPFETGWVDGRGWLAGWRPTASQ